MNRNILFIIFTLVTLGCFFMFSNISTSDQDFDSELSYDLVKKGALLIDVRSPEEYSLEHVDNAINIPYDEIKDNLSEIDQRVDNDKNKAIVVYCKSGQRSAIAKKVLQDHGYKKVINHGGIDSWKKENK
jgi:phage shock protein E